MMTEYVATRWYRAPELLMSWKEYTPAIDMWSVGCILAELLIRKPLLPGENYMNQLLRIISLIGKPKSHDLEDVLSNKAKQFILNLPPQEPKNLKEVFKGGNPLAIDLIEKLLIFNPVDSLF